MSLAELVKLEKQTLFLSLQPSLIDFTSGKKLTLAIRWNGPIINIELPTNGSELTRVAGLIGAVLANNIVIAWDLKPLFSYVLYKTRLPLPLPPSTMFFELRMLEWYLGREDKCPETLAEAVSRFKNVVKSSSWNNLKTIHSSIYKPLVVQTIPNIESIGVTHYKLKRKLHSCYEMLGQANGRLRCTKISEKSFNPHSITEDDIENFRTPFSDYAFLYLDFKHMEVSVLQWLSKDPELGKIIESDKDVYNGIWEALTGIEANPKYRQFTKDFFLPTVYGLGLESLVKRTGMSEMVASRLVKKMQEKFSVGLEWVKNRGVADGVATDVFGRQRYFDEVYKSWNFHVQSPAALFCLKKLVYLEEKLQGVGRIAFHVHDGYFVYSPQKKIQEALDKSIEALTSEENMFSGLRLRVSCKTGATLKDMKEYNIKCA